MNQETSYKILLVDDEKDFVDELVEYLGRARPNWITTPAYDGPHALELLKGDSNYQAAVIDLRMPHMAGDELLPKVVELYPDICPIILTAYGDIPKAVLATKTGAYDFQTKPIKPDELIGVIEEGIAFHRMSVLAEEILTKLDAEAVFDTVIRIAALCIPLSGYYLAIIEREDGRLIIKRAYPGPGGKPIVNCPIPDTMPKFVKTVFDKGESLRLVDVKSEDQWGTITDAKSLLAVPLRLPNDRVRGVLSIEGTESEAFSNRDWLYLRLLAGFVAIALHNTEVVSRVRYEEAKQRTRAMAHQIRNTLQPAATAHGFLRTWPPEDQEDYERHLNIIIEAIKECNELIAALIHFDRVAHLETEDISIHNLIEGVRGKLKEHILQQGATIETDYAPSLPRIPGDRKQLTRVFENLIQNAADAIATKGEPGKIAIQTGIDEARRLVKIRVSDTGIGVPPENRLKIFDLFFTTKPGRKGFGLGLADAKKVVEQHGGDIQLESPSVGGAVFTVFLPLKEK